MDAVVSKDLVLVDNFFKARGWTKKECNCGKIYYSKINSTASSCGTCSDSSFTFRDIPRKKSIMSPGVLNTKALDFFSSKGFSLHESLNVARTVGGTDLIVAGVQVFDPIIHGYAEVESRTLFIAQPSIRMQFVSDVSGSNGTSTSFVNICTEVINISITEHLENLDQWFTFLSSLGIHFSGITLIPRLKTSNWGTGDFNAIEIFIVYAGLELGDANYMNIMLKNSDESIVISDIGLGLERILWAINKTTSYFDVISPHSFNVTEDMYDSVRTITLLVCCGVIGSNKGPGLQFRRIARKIYELNSALTNVRECVEYAHSYWINFIDTSVSTNTAFSIIKNEIDRLRKDDLRTILLTLTQNVPLPKQNESYEEYIEKLVYNNISIDLIKGAVSKNERAKTI